MFLVLFVLRFCAPATIVLAGCTDWTVHVHLSNLFCVVEQATPCEYNCSERLLNFQFHHICINLHKLFSFCLSAEVLSYLPTWWLRIVPNSSNFYAKCIPIPCVCLPLLINNYRLMIIIFGMRQTMPDNGGITCWFVWLSFSGTAWAAGDG